MKKLQQRSQNKLLDWFQKHKRNLPWRQTKDPYSIWISEVMLQQTTSKAVIPYYIKFLKKFPHLKKLSQAKKTEVFSLWSGLGYYRRAENLIKAAQELQKLGRFPKSYKELLLLPGFGDYTSRSVASLAFKEAVGVVDGNVIRLFSRFYETGFQWWKTKDKKELQARADLWVQGFDSSLMNQSLMELGSLICVSQQPLCLLCPISKDCKAFKNKTQNQFPLKRIKKSKELWYWSLQKITKNSKWAFVKNKKTPFLKDKILFPGTLKKVSSKPKQYDFSHNIMNYQIFVHVKSMPFKKKKNQELQWFTKNQAKKLNPSSLIEKVFTL